MEISDSVQYKSNTVHYGQQVQIVKSICQPQGTLLVGLSEGLLVGEPNRIVWPVTCRSMAIVCTANKTNTFYK